MVYYECIRTMVSKKDWLLHRELLATNYNIFFKMFPLEERSWLVIESGSNAN